MTVIYQFQGFISSSKFLLVVFVFLLSGCGSSSSDNPVINPQPAVYIYRQPVNINDGWTTADATTLGINTDALELVVQNIIDQEEDFQYIDALVVIKDGQLILEETFKSVLDFTDDWSGNRDIDIHILNSVTKSFNSALIGIAIDQQLIPDVDVLIHDYFQEKFPIQNWSNLKAGIEKWQQPLGLPLPIQQVSLMVWEKLFKKYHPWIFISLWSNTCLLPYK